MPTNSDVLEQTVSTRELADLIGVSTNMIYKLAKKANFEDGKVGQNQWRLGFCLKRIYSYTTLSDSTGSVDTDIKVQQLRKVTIAADMAEIELKAKRLQVVDTEMAKSFFLHFTSTLINTIDNIPDSKALFFSDSLRLEYDIDIPVPVLHHLLDSVSKDIRDRLSDAVASINVNELANEIIDD